MAKRAAGDNPRAQHFIKNGDLLAEIIACKANNNTLSEKLAKMLLLLCDRYSYSHNWQGYSYREDMRSAALINLVQNWMKFDETKSSNPFAFYTTAMYRSFLQYMGDEKKQRNIRDELLIDAGANPSWGYSDGAKTAEVQSTDDKVEKSEWLER